jgi:hypothetical protein
VALGVVVEVDMDVAALGEPALRIGGPLLQRALAVARRVLAGVTVQPHVHELARHLAPHREVRRVAHAHGDAVAAHHRGDLVGEPAPVAQLERVTDAGPRPECLAELAQARHVALEVARQLPHDGRELLAQRMDLVAQPDDRLVATLEPLVVRDEPVALEREPEVRGRLLVPALVGLRLDLRVEAAVDLERVERRRGDLQPALHRRIGVEMLPPPRVDPAAGSDIRVRHA